MSQEKINRRKAAGDVDPTMTSKSNMTLPGAPQPMPGAPQSSANMMNNPQVAESMGGPFATAREPFWWASVTLWRSGV